jgi:hypothetical protein
MMVLVEYLIRLRLEEPSVAPTNGESGETMALLIGEIEDVALEQEIVSRTVLAGSDQPSRVRCAARSLNPTRHFSMSQRWQIRTPNDDMLTICSAACALSWIVHEGLPADVGAIESTPESEAA